VTVLPNAKLEVNCLAQLPKGWRASGQSIPQSRTRVGLLSRRTVIVSPSDIPMTRASISRGAAERLNRSRTANRAASRGGFIKVGRPIAIVVEWRFRQAARRPWAIPSDDERLAAFIPLLNMPTNIEIELLRQNDMLRGAVIFAMDKIRQIRAGQQVDSTAVLETLGRHLSEARATNEELFAGMVAPELVRGGPPECS
jgi:hypothetical protein